MGRRRKYRKNDEDFEMGNIEDVLKPKSGEGDGFSGSSDDDDFEKPKRRGNVEEENENQRGTAKCG